MFVKCMISAGSTTICMLASMICSCLQVCQLMLQTTCLLAPFDGVVKVNHGLCVIISNDCNDNEDLFQFPDDEANLLDSSNNEALLFDSKVWVSNSNFHGNQISYGWTR